MIKGIDHVALMTCDAERAARFFIDVLGFRESGRLGTPASPHGVTILVSLGGAQIELFGYGDAGAAQGEERSPGYKHLALLVEDIDAEYERLQAAGVEFTMAPTDAGAGLRVAFFQDPDGNSLELMQRS